MVGTIVDKYRVLKILGEGGMGRVYEAVEQDTGRRVALKTLRAELASDGEMLARFRSEARALSTVRHQGLVEIYATGTLPSGESFIAMEFLDGQSLRRRMSGPPMTGPMSGLEYLSIVQQVAQTLSAVHAKQIVHRDLKPENIILVGAPGEAPKVKLVDFGIAKLSTVTATQTQIVTRTGVYFGTPSYMAPEQCGGEGEICDRTDVYSLGVLLYELAAGRPPFVGETDQQVIGKHLFQEAMPLRQANAEVPADIELLVHTMLAKNPARRPSMELVASAVAALSRGERLGEAHTQALRLAREAATVRYGADSSTARLASPRQRWFLIVLSSLVVLLTGLVFWMLRQRVPAAPPPFKVLWTLTSDPPGARVTTLETKIELGVTPCELIRDSEPGQQNLVLAKDGYQPKTISLRRDQAESRQVMLDRLPPTPPQPRPAAQVPAKQKSQAPGPRRSRAAADEPAAGRKPQGASPSPVAEPNTALDPRPQRPLTNKEIPIFERNSSQPPRK